MDIKQKQFKETINGVEYTAQFYGIREALRAEKIYTDPINGKVDKEKLYDYICQNVIVDPPNLTIEDFDDFEILDEVMAFGVKALRNKFRTKSDERTTKGRSKK
jgi:hypothetical protein